MKLRVQQDVRLAPLTTLGIGGPARYFARAISEPDVVDCLSFALEKHLDVFVLGGGSNILVSDAGFDGLVLKIDLSGVEIVEATKPGFVRVTAGAGEDWDALVSLCIGRDLAGIECLSGIPGSVGGTPVQNVGAYGQEVSESIVIVRALDRESNEIVELNNSDCGFAYRTSIFNTTHRGRFIVLSVTYELESSGAPKIEYKDLLEKFPAGRGSLTNVREAVLEIRRSKSMVIEAGDPNSRSAGSFFKNPIVEDAVYARIADGSKQPVPRFPAGEGHVKIPAAWLIEQSGFHKGFTIGNAGISSRHTLAIINRGEATAVEILALKEAIQAAVNELFGVALMPEPIFVGFD